MSPTIHVSYVNKTQAFSIEDLAVTHCHLWDEQFLPELVAMILANRPSMCIVYSPDGPFQFECPETNPQTSSQKVGNITYSVAGPAKWNKSDIENLVRTMEFELSTLWFLVTSEKKVHPDEMYDRVFNKLNTDDGKVEEEVECIGRVADGKILAWYEPTKKEVARVNAQFDTLCDKFNFKLG